MKNLFLLFVLFTTLTYAQDQKKLSSASEFIDRSSYVQINLDENEKATFKSGIGETVDFYPAEIIDLKQDSRMYGLTVESTFVIGQQGMATKSAKETAWIGMEEIGDLIVWLENYVMPNLEKSVGNRRTIKYIFNTKEITILFEIYNNTQIFSVKLNNTLFPDKYFWTESRVKDIPKVLTVLKYLQTKK